MCSFVGHTVFRVTHNNNERRSSMEKVEERKAREVSITFRTRVITAWDIEKEAKKNGLSTSEQVHLLVEAALNKEGA